MIVKYSKSKLQNSLPVWQISAELPAAPVNRRLSVIVDTTDSCWPAAKSCIEKTLNDMITQLSSGDQIELWVMGKDKKPRPKLVLKSDSTSEKSTVSRNLISVLEPYRGGTWLAETLTAVKDHCVSEKPYDVRYLIIITDGEIFDREGVALPFTHFKKEHILVIWLDSRHNPIWDKSDDIMHVDCGTVDFKTFLALPSVSVVIQLLNPGDRRFYTMSETVENRLKIERVETIKIKDFSGESITFFCIGSRKAPEFSYCFTFGAITSSIPSSSLKIIQTGRQVDRRFLKEIAWKHPNWDFKFLNQIYRCLRNKENTKIKCRHCNNEPLAETIIKDRLYSCRQCKSIYIIKDKVSDNVPDQNDVLLFPVTEEGIENEPKRREQPFECKTYNIHKTENKEEYLVICFKKDVWI